MSRGVVQFLASSSFTLACIALTMLLVIFGTMAQIDMGTFAAQKIYFSSFWVFADAGGVHVPVMPGGLTVGILWLLSIVASFVCRRSMRRRPGMLITHCGLVVMLLGQGLTQVGAEETSLAIEEGQTKNYTESRGEHELVVLKNPRKESSEAARIPLSTVVATSTLNLQELPFTMLVKKYFANSRLSRSGSAGMALATQGAGMNVSVQGIPLATKDEEGNLPSAFIEIKNKDTSLGVWLASLAIDTPQAFTIDGQEYGLLLRVKRNYLPFSLTLKKFTREMHPGSDLPKRFSSLVQVDNPSRSESREVLIYMNHPLRYEGLAFYQASFGKNDTLSVFQVVDNKAWLTPYIACILVTVGLLIEFIGHFLFRRAKGGPIPAGSAV